MKQVNPFEGDESPTMTWNACPQMEESSSGMSGQWVVGKNPLTTLGGPNSTINLPVVQRLSDFQIDLKGNQGGWTSSGDDVKQRRLTVKGISDRGAYEGAFTAVRSTAAFDVNEESVLKMSVKIVTQPHSHSFFMVTVYDAADRSRFYNAAFNRKYWPWSYDQHQSLTLGEWKNQSLGIHTLWANFVLGKPNAQSSECCGGSSGRAVDGNPSPSSRNDATCTHTWWRVDLLDAKSVAKLRISARDCCASRHSNLEIYIGNSSAGPRGSDETSLNAKRPGGANSAPTGGSLDINFGAAIVGRYVSVFKPATSDYLTICEAKVYGDIDCTTVQPIGTVVTPPEKDMSGWGDYTATVKMQAPVSSVVGMLVRNQLAAPPANSTASPTTADLMKSARLYETFDCPSASATISREGYSHTSATTASAQLISGATFEWGANRAPLNDRVSLS